MPGSRTKGRTEFVFNTLATPVCCPLCQQMTSTQDFLHVNNFTIIMRKSKLAHLTVMEAMLFSILLKHRDGIPLARLISAAYRNTNEPKNAASNIYVFLNNLKRKIKPLAITVTSISRNYVVQFCD